MRLVSKTGIAILAAAAVAAVMFDIMRPVAARYLFALVAALIVGVIAFYLVPEPLPELTRAEFMAEVRAGHVRRVEIEDQEVIIVKVRRAGNSAPPYVRSFARRSATLSSCRNASTLQATSVQILWPS